MVRDGVGTALCSDHTVSCCQTALGLAFMIVRPRREITTASHYSFRAGIPFGINTASCATILVVNMLLTSLIGELDNSDDLN